MHDILNYLRREDKWYLGGGNRMIWAPQFPLWLDKMGFWDEGHYYNAPLSPLFTITLLDEQGREIPYRFRKRTWQPNVIVQYYDTDIGLELVEWKSMLPSDVLVSKVAFRNRTAKPLGVHVMMWTAQSAQQHRYIQHPTAELSTDRPWLGFEVDMTSSDVADMQIGCAFGMNGYAVSHATQVIESPSPSRMPQPKWMQTPFYELFDGRFLNDQWHKPDLQVGEEWYAALHQFVSLDPVSKAEKVLNFGFATAPSVRQAAANLTQAFVFPKKVLQTATATWQKHFASVPIFVCDNPHLQKYYWYRWYGLRLCSINDEKDSMYPYPYVTEGLGADRKPTAASAASHILEARWLPLPELGQGSFLNMAHHQAKSGAYHVHSLADWNHGEQTSQAFSEPYFSHLKQLYFNHPDPAFLQLASYSLERYANYCDQIRDREKSGLYDDGQESENGQPRLKSVAATVSVYETKRFLAWIAEKQEDKEEAETWHEEAAHIKQAVLKKMWDEKAQMFFDFDMQTGKRRAIKAPTCFYPYFTDLVSQKHLAGFKHHLFDPTAFWTNFPVPTLALNEPHFDDLGRNGNAIFAQNQPENGRVWVMNNCHIAEALAHAALRLKDKSMRSKTAEFITKFVKMLFLDGDVNHPTSFAHYNPFNGKPSIFRDMDDHQSSWINDLIIKYVCGIRPAEQHVIIDPFPFELQHFEIKNVPVRGHLLDVRREQNRIYLYISGNLVAESKMGHPIKIEI